MIPKVYSKKEALEWFIENHSGSVSCVNGSESKTCSTFLEADEFYNKNQK